MLLPSTSYDENGLCRLAGGERFCSISGGLLPVGADWLRETLRSRCLPVGTLFLSAQLLLTLANNSSSSTTPGSFLHLTTCFSIQRLLCLLLQEASANIPQSWLQPSGWPHPPLKLVHFLLFTQVPYSISPQKLALLGGQVPYPA